MMDETLLLRHVTLARLLKVRPEWLAQEAEAGRIPALFAGDCWLCDPEAVQKALLERARKRRSFMNEVRHTEDFSVQVDGDSIVSSPTKCASCGSEFLTKRVDYPSYIVVSFCRDCGKDSVVISKFLIDAIT